MIFLRITKVSGETQTFLNGLVFVTEQARHRTSPKCRDDRGVSFAAAVTGRQACTCSSGGDLARLCEDRKFYILVSVTTMS